MTRVTVPDVATNDLWTASNQNTYVGGNINGLNPYTTAGDMAYAPSSSGNLIRIPVGTSRQQVLSVSGGVPAYDDADNTITRVIGIMLNDDVALIAGDDAARFRIPPVMSGFDIIGVAASRKSGTGTLTIQIRNVTDGVDVLSTKITIDSGETDSATAAIPPVIDTSKDNVAIADQFAIDIDDAGTSTLFAYVEIRLRKP